MSGVKLLGFVRGCINDALTSLIQHGGGNVDPENTKFLTETALTTLAEYGFDPDVCRNLIACDSAGKLVAPPGFPTYWERDAIGFSAPDFTQHVEAAQTETVLIAYQFDTVNPDLCRRAWLTPHHVINSTLICCTPDTGRFQVSYRIDGSVFGGTQIFAGPAAAGAQGNERGPDLVDADGNWCWNLGEMGGVHRQPALRNPGAGYTTSVELVVASGPGSTTGNGTVFVDTRVGYAHGLNWLIHTTV